MSSYIARINKALEYIDQHLDEEINVSKLANISGFSLYHFHRIFKANVRESPYDFLLRLRLEKAIFLLKYRRQLSIAEVGYESGFSSPENFSRLFKERYEVTPGTYRKNTELHKSRIHQERQENDFYIRIEQSREMPKASFTLEIEQMPETPVVVAKAIFGADGSGLVEKYLSLMDWAQEHGINIKGNMTRFGMSIDNPEVTPASKYRYDFALKVEGNPPLAEGLEWSSIPSTEYATVHAQGSLDTVAQAWDYIYRDWLPNSGYVPEHLPAVEEFIQGPEEIGWEKFNLKCRVPITKTENE
ncbi:MAG: AraC family transcriptional regulator [Bacteroidia bacterium]|nr:AraC family transcriptional regulator [Bacteroidia bacterium]